MNTTEYRQKSAEALGFCKKGICQIENWQPDIDADQREKIEDWLIDDQKRDLNQYVLWIWDGKVKEVWYKEYNCSINEREDNDLIAYSKSKESKSIAFGKAFMKYIKSA